MLDESHGRLATSVASAASAERIFAGEGEMAARMRALDWSASDLGPVESWPESLTSVVSLCLASRVPFALYWGENFNLLYNDAWRPIAGDKHPGCLARSGREVWPEIWETIGPLFQGVVEAGESVWEEDSLLPMHRSGYLEECYFSFNLSPCRGKDARVNGIVNIVIETTYRVINERRTKALRALAARVGAAKSTDDVCRLAAMSMADHPAAIPFAILYLVDADEQSARRAGLCGLPPSHAACPLEIDLAPGAAAASPWPLASVVESLRAENVDDLPGKVGAIVGAAWPEPVLRALALPIKFAMKDGAAGVLVVGVSPRRALDDNYRIFFDQLAGHIATALTHARTYEGDRQRADKLADLDRAKTEFFGNISHEFRTPLTLILGHLDDALAHTSRALAGDALQSVRRNARRLLSLVNSLLDFSRIEAGRLQSSFEPTDLHVLTGGLAGSFQSLVESAGMELVVDCPPLEAPVYVDPAHWEKIVLNLVSNAFKFTFEGQIAIRLRAAEGHVELSVSDTGTGIPAHDLPKVFERFHRVEGSRGRSFEGSGIGLALVSELVKAHGGTVRVESVVGRGSTFVVSLPFGSGHLPKESVSLARTSKTGPLSTYPAEVATGFRLRSLDPESETPLAVNAASLPPSEAHDDRRVLVADDNADMRAYIRRILEPHWQVEVVEDGQAALALALANPPDLVLSDVMMPVMDGVALLRALRADPRTAAVPVVLLSARAGEEAVLEGIETGADDYLVKPFSARELVTRIRTHLEMARTQQRLQAQLVVADRMAVVGTLAAGVAHEINNPLSNVTANLDLIAEEVQALSGDSSAGRLRDLGDMVNEARQGAERVRKIVRGMKTFSRADEERRAQLDVQSVLELSINMTFHEIKHRARVVKDYGKVPLVEADEARLGQVFVNLLVNAAHATPQGHADQHEIRIVTGTDVSGRAIIEIRDTGLGMPPEVLRRVFDPFFTTRDIGQGTGLGLSICRNIVTALGGEILAKSEPGKGSTFRVVLPPAVLEVEEQTEAPLRSRPPPAGRSGQVLVVEDDPMVGRTFRRVLGKEHEVTLVTDGKQALDLLVGGKWFDAIICDLMMPNMTGMDLHAELARALPATADRMVFMTGGAFTPAGRGFLDSVPNTRFEKPFPPQNLRALVRSLVR
jgi:signal transduction histidine kinase